MEIKDLAAAQMLKKLVKFLRTKWSHYDKLEADGLSPHTKFSIQEAAFYIDIPVTLLQELIDKGEVIIAKKEDGGTLITKQEAINVLKRHIEALDSLEMVVNFYLKSTEEKSDELGL